MRKQAALVTVALGLCIVSAGSLRGDDVAKRVKKAVEESTLDQRGTKPFHLKAQLTPSRERDKDSGRTGEVEIWWKSPSEWRREVQCPVFHQIEVVNDDRVSQKNEGDYFPEWLREAAVAVVSPVPNLPEVLKEMASGEVKSLMGMTYVSWMIHSSNGRVDSWIGAALALNDRSGLLTYGGGFGWGGAFTDYGNFHGRTVAQVVKVGSPEVTARITKLEVLNDEPGLFAEISGADPHPIQTLLMDEAALRKNLLDMPAVEWPAVRDGPLEGAITTDVTVDRHGLVRETGTIVSTNNALSETAREAITKMRFQPFVVNGEPVQVVARVTLGYKTVRAQ